MQNWIFLYLAYSRLSVSGDDRKSERATSGVWERKREDALISPGSPSSPTRFLNLPHWPRSWNSLIFDEMEWWMKISFVFYLVKPQKPCLHGIASIVRVLWASIDYEQSKYFLCPSRFTWKKAREENCCAESSSLILCSQFSSRSFFSLCRLRWTEINEALLAECGKISSQTRFPFTGWNVSLANTNSPFPPSLTQFSPPSCCARRMGINPSI